MRRIFKSLIKNKLFKMEKIINTEYLSYEGGPVSKNPDKMKYDKKLNKKLAKAINVILFHEGGKIPNIFSDNSSRNIWIYHFGNGDEEDQLALRNYLTSNFGSCRVYIFPGISYGFAEFDNLADAEKVMKHQDKLKIDFNTQSIKGNAHTIRFNNEEKIVFTFYSKVELAEVCQNNISTFPIANYKVDIPGLYVIDNFITEEEEKELVDEIEKQTWNKLSNRRVQHYGYEFLYGVNSINKEKKIGELPDFCNNLMKSKYAIILEFENLLKTFKQVKEDKQIFKPEIENEGKDFFELFGNFDQLTINDYTPGDGIPPHVDTHSPFEDV
jgi:alkylated DNA repair protein alkB family protein 8